ncbi:hypothetical protein MIB92_15285 [Aestuariirhabdus sp. Z084]|uniref:hypothetical protein n=1 Tax=Aestuariirhabdus haliotis TaxID=2918751 RepID=UPI00201B3DB1|nr:hypothetical protein [Aestuariirhabdus haliotis]MCL6417023.1 hypothetical protein [Aestuariirhabdus haliotis]MCL6421056.1 hypothetical protein [Aestuariirhabdus haliotis]
MGDILPFKKPSLKQRAKGKTLCKNGFHKWEIETQKQFDVKQGSLVTAWRCKRCGERKVKAL